MMIWPPFPPRRWFWSPTSFWTPSRFGSSCGGAMAGRSASSPADNGPNARRTPPRFRPTALPRMGDIVELNEAARAFVSEVTVRLRRDSGVALLVDYGPAQSAAGDSLQALADKRPVNPLAVAGSADLTAHVDFAGLAGVARSLGARVQGPEPQGSFLTALGLFQRVERLAKQQPDQAAAVTEAARRLAEPGAMGHLFKVLAIASPSCPLLPGFP